MTSRTLTSSHVNYLVWRYLQESGYGDSARLLARDWDTNPEGLPFSKLVRPHALINVIQDGLWIDQLESDTRQSARRYNFCGIHRLKSVPPKDVITDGFGNVSNFLEDKPTGSKFSVNGLSQETGIMATNKRRRKVNGTEVQNGGNISAGEESEVFLPFSGGKSFTSAEQLPQLDQRPSKSTLKTGRSIGVQCEASTDLLPHSIVFDVESNSEAVMHTKWSFDEANMLLVASESHPRFYEIPLEIAPNKSALSQLNTSHSILEEPAMVTALCWISATDAILAVWNESIDIVEEDVASSKVILLRSFGTEATVISSILQVVFALRWRAETRRLLGICGNDLKGAIWLWDAATGQTLHFLPMDTTILDAVWLSDSHFCICGHGLLQIYVIDVKLKLQKSYSTHVQWEQVKYDPLHRVVACLSLEQNILGICNESDSDISTINFTEGNLTGMDFQPNALTENHTANFDEKAPSILATSSDSGIIQLWDASCPFQQLHRIHMDVPIMAMDFSPNGQLLAAAGFDNINIWSNERGAIPVASWQPPANEWKSDISDNDAESVPDHALSWNADSTKLVYMLGNQVAIIAYPGDK